MQTETLATPTPPFRIDYRQVRENLVKAKGLLQERYTKGTYARTAEGLTCEPNAADAKCFCALGALCKVTGVDTQDVHYSHEADFLNQAIMLRYPNFSRFYYSITSISDRGQDEMLQMFDRAISLAGQGVQ